MEKSGNAYMPLFLAVMLGAGIFIGLGLSKSHAENPVFSKKSEADKLKQIIRFIEEKYVDPVNEKEIVDDAIVAVLTDLDPHSYYIAADEMRSFTEPLEGNFDGIGVEFIIQKDTIVVVSPVEGGPSEKLGIQAGDRIVSVEGQTVAGTGISNDRVIKLLRGEKGSEVNIEIFRKGKKNLLPFTIERGEIPIHSVAVTLSLDEETAYIKITRFARNTYSEFKDGMKMFAGKNIKNLVIDLRGNGGGYLNTAIELADELLPAGKMIVYTEGKSQPYKSYKSTSKGKFENVNLVILINEGSASASEILAGAIQDNDRGEVIGRRSFGKGLVQDQFNFDDTTAIRLTIARYFTPTGRCIQRPYGNGVDYEKEFLARWENGEMIYIDSISFPDSLKFETPGGKTVYGGGGIMPDIFISVDTMGRSAFLDELLNRGLLNQFSFDYADREREKLLAYGSFNSFNNKFQVDHKIISALRLFASENGMPEDAKYNEASEDNIKVRIKAEIARNIWKNEGYYPLILAEDKAIDAAMEYFSNENNSTLKE